MSDPVPSFKPKSVEKSLVNMEAEMRQIDVLVQELKVFETSNPLNEKVTQALAIVNREMFLFKEFFIKRGILVAYHGSLQYKDPRNLDLDLTFTTEDGPTISANKKAIWEIARIFEGLSDWPEINGERECSSNFAEFSIQEIVDEAKDLENTAFNDDIHFSELDSAYILTSKVLFPEQERLQEELKRRVTEILRESLVLRREVIRVLRNTVNTRKERKIKRDSKQK